MSSREDDDEEVGHPVHVRPRPDSGSPSRTTSLPQPPAVRRDDIEASSRRDMHRLSTYPGRSPRRRAEPTTPPDTTRKRVSFSSLTAHPAPNNRRRNRPDNLPPHVREEGGQSSLPGSTSIRRLTTSLRRTTNRSGSSSDARPGLVRSPTTARRRPAIITTTRDSPKPRGRRTSAVSLARSILNRNSSGSSYSGELDPAAVVRDADKNRATYRRYRVGDSVLVENHQSHLSNLVNRWGYPAGGGKTPEEMRGPYMYVLATVTKVHFEEVAEYYTVTRADTEADQRADAEMMEPIRSAKAEAAALQAAQGEWTNFDDHHRGDYKKQSTLFSIESSRSDSKVVVGINTLCCILTTPFVWIYDTVGPWAKRAWLHLLACTRRKASNFLNGSKPFYCSMHITAVNILVFCSTWYMFIDQARLAFFPKNADYPLAIISLIVWLILILELVFEVFIRPDGYRSLIVSEKAYNPTTVRYINWFHLAVESVALVFFIPEFQCLFTSSHGCSDRPKLSFFNACIISILGPNRINVFAGRSFIALVRLRVCSMVRHWKNMWINNTLVNMKWKLTGWKFSDIDKSGKKRKNATEETRSEEEKKDTALTNASNIGTALMVTNSHRSMVLFFLCFALYPLLICFEKNGGANRVTHELATQLQANNLAINDFSGDTIATCDFWADTILAWTMGVTSGRRPELTTDSDVYLLYLEIQPPKCASIFGESDGVLTTSICQLFEQRNRRSPRYEEVCQVWGNKTTSTTEDELAARAGIRPGAITVEERLQENWNLTYPNGTVQTNVEFKVVAKFNNTFTVEPAAFSSLLLQFAELVFILAFLSLLWRDAGILVLNPLRRMLKIVARYAKNPLADIKIKSSKKSKSDNDTDDGDNWSSSDGDESMPERQLGNFETEQLISAVAKITDLLRKCWGVAGADIISTNLATEGSSLSEVFNPTVPGKSVYALFGFCAISGFDQLLRSLGGDIMILVNDVANVLHEEVFRWGFGNSGQCNKNLGSAFLMVFRIGNVKEVVKKLDEATHVVFSNSNFKRKDYGSPRKRRNIHASRRLTKVTNADIAIQRMKKPRRMKRNKSATLSLASLPGICAFTDRALIGMLKTFAGIHRDPKLLAWKNDFRLGAGVGAFSVEMIFGMDAGWAVEGAVGSEYKIDATYLSPHVNMASRMMSACKQYGVSILLSQAVQELLSDTARSKLRHLDTVTVKGSSVKQRIYTYDARHKGVDFFLFSKTDEQADADSDQYSPNIWNTDQDLTSMRQHVTEDFEEEFSKGRDEYLAGHWPAAIKHLEAANEIMVENVFELGYIEAELEALQQDLMSDGEDARLAEQELRSETEDGPSRRLLTVMESHGGVAPANWHGYRPLTSK